jgi:hypothetical protein
MKEKDGSLSKVTKPIPVRIHPRLRARIRAAAKRMGSNASAVIRFSVLQQLPAIEAGRIELVHPEK